MAKSWYPVIDYSSCTECGTCSSKCPHQVYDMTKAPVPVVLNPASCIDHCHGCGNRCPVGAITYVGENTGWTPKNGTPAQDDTTCSCGGDCTATKTVLVEYLYLDLHTCERCVGTDTVLEEVIAALTPALALAGFTVEYRKLEMATREAAIAHRFLSSRPSASTGTTSARPLRKTTAAAAAKSAERRWTVAYLSIAEKCSKCRPKQCWRREF